jgi:hypothetical protein
LLLIVSELAMLGTDMAPAMACPAGTHPVCSYDGGPHSHCHCE